MGINDYHKHEQTPQELQNRSFDPTFDVAASEILGYDAAGGALRRIAVNSDGQLESLGINSLITAAFDYIALTYVAAGNGEGEKHPNWKGDKAGYSAIHIWVKSRKKRPEMCEECGKKKNYSLHLSNVDHKYSRNIEDYRYLCASCHKLYDLEKGLVSH